MCRINPRVDFAFKKLFGSEENKDLLIALLNAILSEEPPITEVVLKNPYSLADYLAGKMSILDIKAHDANGRWFNVEMQISEDLHFDKRAVYYWAKLVTEQLGEGELYRTLNKTFSINLLEFDLVPGERMHNRYRILNADTGKGDGLHDIFELHYLELRKFRKDYAEIATALDRWVTFLTRAHELDRRRLPPALAADPAIVKAVAAVDRMFDEHERQVYETRLRALRDADSVIESAWEKGREEGREEGLERGARETAEAVARRLAAMGLATGQIAQATGLTEAEVVGLL